MPVSEPNGWISVAADWFSAAWGRTRPLVRPPVVRRLQPSRFGDRLADEQSVERVVVIVRQYRDHERRGGPHGQFLESGRQGGLDDRAWRRLLVRC
jgi:hypothetical protein